MTVLQVLVYVVLQLAITKTINSFDYNFPVYSTKICPMNAKEWDNASIKMNCSDTHGYHCVPDKKFSSLIEFCYPLGGRIPFQKGNCLELAYTGILNHVKCGHFSYGCPEKDYFSNEIYQYPACLRLVKNCFAADLSCLRKRYSMGNQNPAKGNPSENELSTKVYSKDKLRRTEEDDPLLNKDTTRPRHTEGMVGENEENHTVEITSEILSDYSIENAQLFSLLKRQCIIGAYNGFHHLLYSRVIKETYRKDILHQKDKDGLALLHYAAMGGSIQIFDDILKADQNLKVDVKCNRGQTALHYAIRERKVDMSIYLISHFAELLSSIKIDTGQRPEIHRDTKKQITPRFEPIHWIAWIGNLQILETLKRKNGKTSFDMAKTTINELNILHIACLANENDFCKHVMKNETQIDIDITDNCGWNVAHYAARANNSAFFKILKQFKKENLIEIRTKCKKTTLHIACEYASEKVVDYLLENHKTLLDKTDELKWNALHYATKGGNLSILKKIIHNGLNVGSLTNEEKTLLHVACIHKQVDICRYVAEKFVKTNQSALINKKTTNYGWLAAHYLGVERKGNGREEAILDILYDYKMDLKDETDDGHSILDIALEHFNEGLVNYILSAKYIEAMDISKQKLQKAERDARNEEIKASLRRALETFKWH